MDITIPISAIAQCLNRSEFLIRMSLRSLAIEDEQNKITLADAVKVIQSFSGRSDKLMEIIADLQVQTETRKKHELELSIALEMVRRERDLLVKQNQTLDRLLQHANERTDRFEAKLHEMTDAFAHLVEQRDRLIANHKRRKSRVLEIYDNGKPILLLQDPLDPVTTEKLYTAP